MLFFIWQISIAGKDCAGMLTMNIWRYPSALHPIYNIGWAFYSNTNFRVILLIADIHVLRLTFLKTLCSRYCWKLNAGLIAVSWVLLCLLYNLVNQISMGYKDVGRLGFAIYYCCFLKQKIHWPLSIVEKLGLNQISYEFWIKNCFNHIKVFTLLDSF
jgi:hypothetical protein